MDFNKFLTNSEVVFHYSKEVASNAAKLAKVTAFSAIMLTALVACSPSSDEIQHKQQESILLKATNEVGMPEINNYSERKQLRNILEKRDLNLSTITYITDVNGGLHEVCRSIGYGISAGSQFTNPMKDSTERYALPQADPNGLFSPASAEGTWITCISPDTHKEEVVFVGQRVTVSPFALK